MSNFYSSYHDTFEYEDGTRIVFSVRVDQKKLARLVYRASKNKNGKKINGALLIEAKRLAKPEEPIA